MRIATPLPVAMRIIVYSVIRINGHMSTKSCVVVPDREMFPLCFYYSISCSGCQQKISITAYYLPIYILCLEYLINSLKKNEIF